MTEMREPTFLVLTALASGPLHGYGIIREVAALSDDRVNLLPGTLYSALDRLVAQGLVEHRHDEVTGGRLRRYYGLTSAGLEVLQTEIARLRQLAAVAQDRLRALHPRLI
jgi:DNA-binding PadR family transcriptional regulator